jgi:hypothetical protein
VDYCQAGDNSAGAIFHGQPNLDLDGDGRLDAVGLDLDGDGINDDALADFDGDGMADHAGLLGRRIMVVDDDETADDLVGDMIEVLSSTGGRMRGPRGARNRALRAVPAAKQHSAPVAAAG